MVQKNMKCFHCGTLNCAEVSKQNPDAIIWCNNCGIAQNPNPDKLKELDNPNPGNWLPCIPLKGVVAREPLGVTPDGYTSPTEGGAKFYSREEYMHKFFWDPEPYLKFKKNTPQNVPGFECKEPVGPTPQPPSTGDDPAKLKQDQLAGRIKPVDYLAKLMSLLKSGKVTQAYYDAEKKRILEGM